MQDLVAWYAQIPSLSLLFPTHSLCSLLIDGELHTFYGIALFSYLAGFIGEGTAHADRLQALAKAANPPLSSK
jgi:hypothetical protein